MFLSALQPYVVVILIAIVAVQYAFALFCLLKLAYLDISKREYALWNLFILLVFFIGDITFLVYYFKVGKNKHIPDYVPPVESDEQKPECEIEEKEEEQTETKEEVATEEKPEPPVEEKAEEKIEEPDTAPEAEDPPAEAEKPEPKKAPAKKKPAAKKKTQE